MPKGFLVCSLLLALGLEAAPRKVVLIAGAKSHGPAVHEYLKSVKLLKVLLEGTPGVKAEVHFNGWPTDPHTLETASTIVIISDGQPSDRLPPMPLMIPERMAILERQMRRGCGLISIHYSTFITYNFADEALAWQGGYYEWKARQGVTSAIKTIEADIVLPHPSHPVLRGIQPFRMKDEFYYRLRLNTDHAGFVPLLQVPDLPGTASEQTVAWAIQRADGGRGFATSTGHFFSNWKHDSYRKLILNAILWTARVDPPPNGVEAAYIEEAEVSRRLARPMGAALLLTKAPVEEALDSEIPRFRLTRTPGPLSRYRLIVADELSPQLEKYVATGGGLVLLNAQSDENVTSGKGRIARVPPGAPQEVIVQKAMWAARAK